MVGLAAFVAIDTKTPSPEVLGEGAAHIGEGVS